MSTLSETGRPTLRGRRAPNHESYQRIRYDVCTLLADTTANPTVPACPKWTVRDLVAHLVGSAALAIGRLSGWPATQPSSSSEMALPDLLSAWERLGAEVDLLLADRGDRAGTLLVTDAFNHALDLRYAVGQTPPDDDHPAFAVAFDVLANGFSATVAAHGLPALRLSTGNTQWTVGDGEPVATVTAHRYDLIRAIAGRRAHTQITAMSWDRDSHRWLPAFTWGPFTPPESPVEPSIS